MKFDFSIIMAIYNVESYLEEAIESVVNQTIGFDKIELILINDGSPDNCSSICEKYKKLYPDNIVYIEKENEGVSKTRNRGIEISHGKYLNFLDGDDKLDLDTCESVSEFIKKNEGIDLVSIPLMFFENEEGPHVLNYKFEKTRVIDLKEETDIIQLSASSSFIRREAIMPYRFDSRLKYGEDALLVNQVLLQEMKLGVVADSYYWYRKREVGTSAIQGAAFSWDYYLPCVKYYYEELVKLSKEKYGMIQRYLQYSLVYDMKWHICQTDVPANVFHNGEAEEFEQRVSAILKEIDVDIIRNHRTLTWEDKVYLLSLKYDADLKDVYQNVVDSNDIYAVLDNQIIERLSTTKIWIQDISVKNNKIQIDCLMGNRILKDDFEVGVVVQTSNGDIQKYSVKIVDGWRKDNYRWGKNLNDVLYMKCENIEYVSGMQIGFSISMNNVKVYTKIGFGGIYKHVSDLKKSYMFLKQKYLVWENASRIYISDISSDLLHSKETEFIDELEKNESYKEEYLKIKEMRRQALEWRLKSDRNKIWLFIDRIDVADDNAEHLFKFCRNHSNEIINVDMYFLIEKESPHYERMKQYGTVVDYYSDEAKSLYMKADMIISSQANRETYCPFPLGTARTPYMTFLDFKRVFLQHGIIKGNMSFWLHKWKKYLDVFVTASPYEYESIMNGNYGYRDEVKLTGMPRFDGLIDQKEKIILFMPTWNSKFAMYDSKGRQVYNPEFKKTNLFKEIDGVLNNEQLEKYMRQYGYRLLFKPHPKLMVQFPDFKTNDLVTIADQNVPYQELYKKGALLITDFSSAEFDFAYMKKPIIYLQMRDHHIIEGYYDYQNMAFGEVVNTIDDLAEHVAKFLENDCQMEEKYKDRVTKFYAFTDRNNCRRILDILKGM